MVHHVRYTCPGCRTTNNLHEPDCRFEGTRWPDIEKAHMDILAPLSVHPHPEDAVRKSVEGEWSALHNAVLEALERDHRIEAVDAEEEGPNFAAGEEVLQIVPPDERKERLETPQHEPLRTIYEKGSVPGCHDNAVFAMIAYYEMVGLTWPETKAKVVEWLRESGTWARGGFEEPTPEGLVEDKRHVYQEGYGWKEKARAAKSVIDRSL